MSLINDALKRAQEEKNRATLDGVGLTDAAVGEERVEVCSAPGKKKANPMVVVLLVGAIAAGGAWYFLCVKKGPAPASANVLPPVVAPVTVATPKPATPATITPTTPVDNAPSPQPTMTTADTGSSMPDNAPATIVDVTSLLRPPRVPSNLKPPFGNLSNPTLDLLTKQSGPTLDPPKNTTRLTPFDVPNNNFTTNPQWITQKESASETTAGNSADNQAAPKHTPPAETQPAAKRPEKVALDPAVVTQQFRVTCIMFSDRGSTAIVNGSAVKVGQTVRGEGVTKSGTPEDATIKKIDRGCVEIEFCGERYFLRM